jgi:hypothetical protein
MRYHWSKAVVDGLPKKMRNAGKGCAIVWTVDLAR